MGKRERETERQRERYRVWVTKWGCMLRCCCNCSCSCNKARKASRNACSHPQRRQTQTHSYLHKCSWHLVYMQVGQKGGKGYQLVAAAYQLIRCECDFNCCRCDVAFAKLESVIEIYGHCGGNCTAKLSALLLSLIDRHQSPSTARHSLTHSVSHSVSQRVVNVSKHMMAVTCRCCRVSCASRTRVLRRRRSLSLSCLQPFLKCMPRAPSPTPSLCLFQCLLWQSVTSSGLRVSFFYAAAKLDLIFVFVFAFVLRSLLLSPLTHVFTHQRLAKCCVRVCVCVCVCVGEGLRKGVTIIF